MLWAVRWYCRYGVSYRDLEQMMGQRGVSVDHSTIFRWVQTYAPEIEKRLRWQWRRPRSTSWRAALFRPPRKQQPEQPLGLPCAFVGEDD